MIEIVARLRAYEAGRAQPLTSTMQASIRPHARILCPISMAGADTTIHIIACGRIGEPAQVRCVADPRYRADQYQLFHHLSAWMEDYYEECHALGDFPQLIVPSRSAALLVDRLADTLRYDRLDPHVRRLGALLTYPAERLPLAGQQALHAATALLGAHWATGQQPGEDEHLLTQLVWIDPPAGQYVLDAVHEAERTHLGVTTDPEFDKAVLFPLVLAHNRARRFGAPANELLRRRRLIRSVLEPLALRAYNAVQQAIALLLVLDLPPLPDLARLEDREAEEFMDFMRSRDDGFFIPRRDSAKAAVFKLAAREDAAENLGPALRLGDGVGRAGALLEGHIISGVAANPRDGKGASGKREYRFDLVSTRSHARLRPGDSLYGARDPSLGVTVTGIRQQGGATRIALLLRSGQRKPGLPAAGERLELTDRVPDWNRLGQRRGHLREVLTRTPWTHRSDGAPPAAHPRQAPADPLAALEAYR